MYIATYRSLPDLSLNVPTIRSHRIPELKDGTLYKFDAAVKAHGKTPSNLWYIKNFSCALPNRARSSLPLSKPLYFHEELMKNRFHNCTLDWEVPL